MKPTRNPFLLPAHLTLAAMLTLGLGSSATAGTLYWDTNGTTLGGGAAGAWDTTSTLWSADPLGLSVTSTYVADSDVIFSAGVDSATFNCTQASGSTVNANSVTFQEGVTTVNGSSSSKLNLTGTGGNITVNTGATGTVGGGNTETISGTVGLTKLGGGTLTLNPFTAGSFTGGVRVNGGTLALSFTGMTTTSNPTTVIGNGNALSFSGGAMTVTGRNAATTSSQTFLGVTVNAGGSLLVNPSGGTSTTVALGSLGTLGSWPTGSSLALGKVLTATGAAIITTTTLPTNSLTDGTGTYGSRIVFGDGTASTGYNWATTLTGVSPYTLSAYSGYVAAATSGTDTNNSSITATTTLAGALTTNSLKLDNPAATQTLELDTNLLTLSNGGLLSTGTNAFAINGTPGARPSRRAMPKVPMTWSSISTTPVA